MSEIVKVGNQIVTSEGKVVTYSGSVIAPMDRYYYGVLLGDERPISINFMNLIRVNESSNVPVLPLTYPYIVGWHVLVEHITAPRRTRWTDGYSHETPIEGEYDDFNPFLFPEPFMTFHDGQYWRVYLTSYITLIGNITFLE